MAGVNRLYITPVDTAFVKQAKGSCDSSRPRTTPLQQSPKLGVLSLRCIYVRSTRMRRASWTAAFAPPAHRSTAATVTATAARRSGRQRSPSRRLVVMALGPGLQEVLPDSGSVCSRPSFQEGCLKYRRTVASNRSVFWRLLMHTCNDICVCMSSTLPALIHPAGSFQSILQHRWHSPAQPAALD